MCGIPFGPFSKQLFNESEVLLALADASIENNSQFGGLSVSLYNSMVR